MKFSWVPLSKFNKNEWNDIIEKSDIDLPYYLYDYLNIISSFNVIIEENEGIFFPVPVNKRLLSVRFIQPFFFQQGGPIPITPTSIDLLPKMLEFLKKKSVYINLHLRGEFLSVEDKIKKIGFRINRMADYLLSFPASSQDDIIKRYSENHIRNIEKAQKKSIQIKETISNINEVIMTFISNKGKELMLPNEFYVIFSKLYNYMNSEKLAYSITAENMGKEVYYAIFWKFKKRLIFIFSATSSDAYSTGAPHLTIHNVISKFIPEGYIIDFEGTNDANLARFYEGFGALQCIYAKFSTYYSLNPLQWIRALRL